VVTAGRSSYATVLEEAWARHLAPRAPDAPTVVSLFAGCGGSSLGYSMAGYREVLAVEWNANAAAAFRLNFPAVPLYAGDIAGLTAEQATELAEAEPGMLDVLDGSPPCQGFSTAGRRRLEDPRNDLFREYARLLQGLRPRAFVMENVAGLVKGKMRLVFAECLRALKACGYRVSVRLMDAAYFGVPQHRARMIFVGVRDDLPALPSHPKARQAVLPAGDVIRSPSLDITDRQLADAAIRPTWQMHRVLTGLERRRHFGLVRLKANRPAPTIQRDAGNSTTGMVHPVQLRKLTIPEIKRLSSYPDAFRLAGTYREQWACVGNSVPPLFMEAIARHICQHILDDA
jgi:DNA (cytosine-5)-methyltransferase 1